MYTTFVSLRSVGMYSNRPWMGSARRIRIHKRPSLAPEYTCYLFRHARLIRSISADPARARDDSLSIYTVRKKTRDNWGSTTMWSLSVGDCSEYTNHRYLLIRCCISTLQKLNNCEHDISIIASWSKVNPWVYELSNSAANTYILLFYSHNHFLLCCPRICFYIHQFYSSFRLQTITAQFTHFILLQSIKVIDAIRIGNELLAHCFLLFFGKSEIVELIRFTSYGG